MLASVRPPGRLGADAGAVGTPAMRPCRAGLPTPTSAGARAHFVNVVAGVVLLCPQPAQGQGPLTLNLEVQLYVLIISSVGMHHYSQNCP